MSLSSLTSGSNTMNDPEIDSYSKAKLELHPVENPKLLIPVLEERLPNSCFVYNQAVSCEKFKDDVKFYTIASEINSNTWIVAFWYRVDFGSNVSISAPTRIVQGIDQIPFEVKECFSSSKLFSWNESFVFVALEKRVSAMIFDVSANVKGNVTEAHPCILYFMEKEDALNVSVSASPETELKRLSPTDDSDFIVSTWKYSRSNSNLVIPKCIEANASAGVFVDGKCVSGVIVTHAGLVGLLYTLKEYRNFGYGKLTMNYVFKEAAKDGCFPCSTVEFTNTRSISFHQSPDVNMKPIAIVDYIDVKKLDVD